MPPRDFAPPRQRSSASRNERPREGCHAAKQAEGPRLELAKFRPEFTREGSEATERAAAAPSTSSPTAPGPASPAGPSPARRTPTRPSCSLASGAQRPSSRNWKRTSKTFV